MKRKTTTPKTNRHAFRFKATIGDESHVFTTWAKVKRATQKVVLTLTEADVSRALAFDGKGNSQECAMAVCAKRQRDKFPHPVEGYIDWNYNSAHVVTRVNKDGQPTHCVGYRHFDKIAKLFDTDAGLKKLKAELRAKGPRDITLHPSVRAKQYAGAPTGKKTGERSSKPKPVPYKGARLRYSMIKPGVVLPPKEDKAA